MFFVCPGKERAIHESCTQDLALRCSLEALMMKLKLQYFGHLM